MYRILGSRARNFALAFLLAALLPLKALAAVVIPITGLPQHMHSHSHSEAASPSATHCELMDAGSSAHTDTDAHTPTPLHDHACPHLGMASIPLVVSAVALGGTHPTAPLLSALPPASVVLEVPHPPPTR